MDDLQEPWLAAVRRAIADAMSEHHGGWQDDGRQVVGPRTFAIRVANLHGAEIGHVDLGFVLNRDRTDSPVIWDCVAGGAGELDGAARLAASIWFQTTAPTALELVASGRGEYADHSEGDDGLGLTGWHSIHGPILGYGACDASPLQRWALDHAIVPALREPLAAALAGVTRPAAPSLHGVKFLYGSSADGSTAEVRIDGQRDEASSLALLALPWPRSADAMFVRHFVLFIHSL